MVLRYSLTQVDSHWLDCLDSSRQETGGRAFIYDICSRLFSNNKSESIFLQLVLKAASITDISLIAVLQRCPKLETADLEGTPGLAFDHV